MWMRLSGPWWSVAKESFRFSKGGGGVHVSGVFWQEVSGMRCRVRLSCHLFSWTGRPLVEEAVGDACPWVVARLHVPRSAGLLPQRGVANLSTLEYVCFVNMHKEFELVFCALLGDVVRIYGREQHARRAHV